MPRRSQLLKLTLSRHVSHSHNIQALFAPRIDGRVFTS
jgi:hypothetical protein